MSRNREKNSQSLHWMGVVKWVLILGLLSGLGLGYMFCKNRNLHFAEETHKLEVQLEALNERNDELRGDLEAMKSPRGLERRLVAMHSSLIRLDEMQENVVPMDQSTKMRLVRLGTRNPIATTDSQVTPVSNP
jgi:hypothetical protein